MRTALALLALPLSVFCFYKLARWIAWMRMIYKANGDNLYLVYAGLSWAYCIEIAVYAIFGSVLLWAFAANIFVAGDKGDKRPPA